MSEAPERSDDDQGAQVDIDLRPALDAAHTRDSRPKALRIRHIRRLADLLQLEEAWTQLLLTSAKSLGSRVMDPGSQADPAPRPTVFASFQWNVAWWRHFGYERAARRARAASLHVLTVWSEGERLVGVAPLMVRRLGPLRKLEFLSTGLGDYGDVLVHPDFARDATAAILAYLAGMARHWDLGDLSEVPPNSPLLDYLRHQADFGIARSQIQNPKSKVQNPKRLLATMVAQTPCPVIDLPGTWEAYVGGLARKRRYYVSSFPRKFIREQSGSLEIVSGGPALRDAVAAFHALHMERWEGRKAELSPEHLDPNFEPFLQEACARCAEMGWLRVANLWAGDELAASSLNFLVGGCWNGYMKGFAPRWSNSRPGTVLDSLRIQRAIEEGAQRFDFGRGDEPYKSGYGVRIEENTRIFLAGRTPRSLAGYALMMLRLRYRGARGENSTAGRSAVKDDGLPDDDAP
jgi:hypothetical protein